MAAPHTLDSELRTVAEGAGLLDRSERGKLALTGADAKEFLGPAAVAAAPPPPPIPPPPPMSRPVTPLPAEVRAATGGARFGFTTGMPAMAELYCSSSARVTFRYKDPRGWAEFKQQFADGSATGHATTMRGVQGSRVPFFERTEELKKIAEPMLVVIGDEDDSTHGLAVHLKKHVARSGVLELPKCGHTMNLEEPAAFNAAVQDFLHAVENDRWPAREEKGYTLIPPGRSR